MITLVLILLLILILILVPNSGPQRNFGYQPKVGPKSRLKPRSGINSKRID